MYRMFNKDLSESVLYRSTGQFRQISSRDITELLYLNALALVLLLFDETTKADAMTYARRTVQFNDFGSFRSLGTDSYLLAHAIVTGKNSGIVPSDGEQGSEYLDQIRFDDVAYRIVLDEISRGNIEINRLSNFFIRLEQQLRIRPVRFKSWRRQILFWDQTPTDIQQGLMHFVLHELRGRSANNQLCAPLERLINDIDDAEFAAVDEFDYASMNALEPNRTSR